MAARAFGPDVATLKGKTTRTNPAPAVSNLVEIPDELLETHQDVTISMLSTISHDIYYLTWQYVSQPIASVYKKCLDEVFGTYKHGGFEIMEVHCHFNNILAGITNDQTINFLQTYSLKKGINNLVIAAKLRHTKR